MRSGTMADSVRAARLAVVAAAARLDRAGLNLAAEGNVSVRIDGRSFAVSPRGFDKSRLNATDVVAVELDGEVPGAASSEAWMHRAIYRRLPALAAVVHAHPRHVQSLSTANRLPDWQLLAEGSLLLGRIAWVGYLPPGSTALADAVADALSEARACVLDRHGAVTAAASLDEAMLLMMLLERLAALTSDLRQ
jgi:ribulose-5-phosphate 4-epimerase/fuculose-1-phosphate aldolase